MAHILVAQAGPVCLNVGRMNPKFGKRWRFSRPTKSSACLFFGVGSIAWWKGMRGVSFKIINEK